MKKSIKIIALLLVVSLCFLGCSATKKVKQESSVFLKETSQKDSIQNVVITREIADSLITPIVQSNSGNVAVDSLVNAKVAEILSKLNTTKHSGDNSYTLFYDTLKKQLELYVKIAQSKNENTAVSNKGQKIIIKEQKIPVLIEKPLAKWQKILMGLGGLLLVGVLFKVMFFVSKKTSIWA